MRINIVIVISVLIFSLFSGCTVIENVLEPDREKFVGTWERIEESGFCSEVIEFSDNGEYLFGDKSCLMFGGYWGIKNEKLAIWYGDFEFRYDYTFLDDSAVIIHFNSFHPCTYVKSE